MYNDKIKNGQQMQYPNYNQMNRPQMRPTGPQMNQQQQIMRNQQNPQQNNEQLRNLLMNQRNDF